MDTTTAIDDVATGVKIAFGDEEHSIAAARDGDVLAFEALMNAGLARTYRIATAILGSEPDARDAVQDTWLAAWRQLPSLVDPAKFDAWVDRIVVNACRASLRRRARVREVPMVDGFDAEAGLPGPDQVVARQVLERAFGRLTVEQRTILVLHHLEQRPLSAIAEVLAIPVGTAKSRLHSARMALERSLEAER
jgi:RNA polymerase sigma-70 factor, ECF subfamily